MSRLGFDDDPFFNRSNLFNRGAMMNRNEDFDDMFKQMEQRMNSTRGGGFGGGSNSRSFQTSSHSTVTSHMGPNGQVERKEWKSSEERDTVNGVTTARAAQSSSESHGPMGSRGMALSGGPMSKKQLNFIRDSYEIGADGQLHFKAMFDAKEFHPEDINVTTMDNVMTVTAKADGTNAGDGFVTRGEISRQIQLPRLIDHTKFVCTLTQDGVLVLDAPVNAPDYNSITFDSDHNLAIRARPGPQNRTTRDVTFANDDLISSSSSLNSKLTDDTTISQKRLHLEVPIPPGFNAQDICVSADDSQLYVTAKRDGMEQFKRSFALPRAVDTLSITAEMFDKQLIIEAPYF
ncbi:Heat shock protein [Cichlidogyrus casuarinus]|uniref:Heat shock protein n=1 Tax=Cichlidogyrus casuarinus TaxID=1844966 RepID=A0ABD2QRF5_9PLAT